MKILPEKELAIKKAIIKAIENGQSAAKLADHFGVSKSSIYKYRRILREQGFITKDENDNFVITDVKFSKKTNDANPIEAEKKPEVEKIAETSAPKETHNDEAMEQRLQDKIEKMRDSSENVQENKSLINKIFSFFKK
jgi:DNA-binding transcriptional regulator YhcF (GntR family)